MNDSPARPPRSKQRRTHDKGTSIHIMCRGVLLKGLTR